MYIYTHIRVCVLVHVYSHQLRLSIPHKKFQSIVYCLSVFFQVFPVDYCLFFAIVFYFVYSTMTGMKKIGIRFFWVKVSFCSKVKNLLLEKHGEDKREGDLYLSSGKTS